MKVKAWEKTQKPAPQQLFTQILPKFLLLDKADFLLFADLWCSWLAETHSSRKPCLSHNQHEEIHTMGKEQKQFLAPIKYELLARRFRHLIQVWTSTSLSIMDCLWVFLKQMQHC